MQAKGKRKTFYYHADAHCFGGVLQTPVQKAVPAQASVSLPAVGGHAAARTEAFNLDGHLSCTSSEVRVSGREVTEDGAFSILVTSVIEGLNILEIVTADRIVAQLTVDCSIDTGERRVSVAGSHFERLRIGGHDASPILNATLLQMKREDGAACSPNTWLNFQKTGRQQAVKLITTIKAGKNPDADAWAVDRYEWMTSEIDRDPELALCSLVDTVDGSYPARSLAHIVEIADFGRIFLGELLVSPVSIQLSMIRAELGCNVTGQLSIGKIAANGHSVPPSN